MGGLFNTFKLNINCQYIFSNRSMFRIRFIGVKYFPEDDQDKLKRVRVMANSCNKIN